MGILLPADPQTIRLCDFSGDPNCFDTDDKDLGEPPALACAGNPINITTGNKYLEAVDFSTAGPDILEFRRYYNSQDVKLGRFFQGKWRSTYDRDLIINGSGLFILVRRENGAAYRFEPNGSLWVRANNHADVQFTLTHSGTGYVVTTPDQTEETYDSAGRLTRVTRPSGYQQTLSYNGRGLVSRVTDSHGRELNFEYLDVSPILSKFVDPDGNETLYRYTSNPPLLTRVLHPDRTPGTEGDNPGVRYHYEDGNYPTNITGITDLREGTRFATYGYDANGRATSSEHAGGADQVTVTYNPDGTATVRNALGKDSTYTFSTIQGVEKVTRIDGLASANCPADNSIQTYDANGYLNSIQTAKAT